ncbi:MAG: peptidase M50, partial [Candidatus Atribacteria bacterium]
MFERISRREEADLFLAWMAISLSFAIIKIAPYGILGPIKSVDPMVALIYFGISLLTV